MLSRRQFLVLPLVLLLGHRLVQADQPVRFAATYHADIGILFSLLTFTLDGSVEERVDRPAGRYRVLVSGEGSGVANRIESVGLIRERRFTPTTTTLFFSIRGRESRTHISYDYDHGLVRYRHTSQTFLLGRWRRAEAVIGLPAGQPVDDIVTAVLNFAQNLLEVDGEGVYRTFVVRRARPEREGLDEVQAGGYRAEIAPLRFTVVSDTESGQPVALLDLTRFSSWAHADHPARITFGANRRPETIQASLRLGTTVRVKLNEIQDPPRMG